MRYIDVKTAAKRIGYDRTHMWRLCSSGKLPGCVRKGKSWLIPITAHPLLADIDTPEKLSAAADLTQVNQIKKDQAITKLGHIQQFEKFAREFLATSGGRSAAITAYCHQQGLAERTLRRWMAQFRAGGLPALIDARGEKPGESIISPQAWQAFCGFYLTQQRLSVKICLQMLIHYNQTEQQNWTIPTLRTLQRYVQQQIPKAVAVLHREGQAAYDAACAPYLQTDLAAIEPGSVWVGDHHQFNCFVRHKGRLIRPWITAWEDMASRTIMGWFITDSPNSTTIMRAYKMGIERFGPPASVKIDNGRDYDSQMWTGITKAKKRELKKNYIDEPLFAGLYAMTDTTVSFSIPYHPQSKCIERFFDTLDRQFTRTQQSYCGKTTQEKPDDLVAYLKTERAQRELPSLEEFASQANRWIDEVYNKTPHTGREMNDRAPLEVLHTRTTRRAIDLNVLPLLLRVWSPPLTVGKNGIQINKLWYGQFDETLFLKQGSTVRAAYDPDDVSQVWIYDAKTLRFICQARQAQLTQYGPVAEESVREAHAAKARCKKLAKNFAKNKMVADSQITDLAIAAQAAAAKDINLTDSLATIKPVITTATTSILATAHPMKKAAGAEHQPSGSILFHNDKAKNRYGRFVHNGNSEQ